MSASFESCPCARLEEKLANVESENKVLRQQALAMAQNNKLISRSSRSIMQVIQNQQFEQYAIVYSSSNIVYDSFLQRAESTKTSIVSKILSRNQYAMETVRNVTVPSFY